MTALVLPGGPVPAHHPGRVTLLLLLVALAALSLVAVALMLWPRPESRASIGVPFDPAGPMAQPFLVGDLQGWVVQLPGEEIRVFSARDPRGCYLAFRLREYFAGTHFEIPEGHSGLFRDSCFGSIFLLTGERIFGPSPRGMDSFEVRAVREGGFVIVDMSRVRLGLCGRGFTSPGVFECSTPDEPRYGPARPAEQRSR